MAKKKRKRKMKHEAKVRIVMSSATASALAVALLCYFLWFPGVVVIAVVFGAMAWGMLVLVCAKVFGILGQAPGNYMGTGLNQSQVSRLKQQVKNDE